MAQSQNSQNFALLACNNGGNYDIIIPVSSQKDIDDSLFQGRYLVGIYSTEELAKKKLKQILIMRENLCHS